LPRIQQVAAQGQGQPQRPHKFEGFEEADAQHGRLAAGGAGPLPQGLHANL